MGGSASRVAQPRSDESTGASRPKRVRRDCDEIARATEVRGRWFISEDGWEGRSCWAAGGGRGDKRGKGRGGRSSNSHLDESLDVRLKRQRHRAPRHRALRLEAQLGRLDEGDGDAADVVGHAHLHAPRHAEVEEPHDHREGDVVRALEGDLHAPGRSPAEGPLGVLHRLPSLELDVRRLRGHRREGAVHEAHRSHLIDGSERLHTQERVRARVAEAP